MKFIPALLTNSTSELQTQLSRCSQHFDRVSIDIVDEKYSSTPTYQIRELLNKKEEWVNENTNKLTYDFDLMVYEWEEELKFLADLSSGIKVDNVFLHVPTLSNKPYPITINYPFAIGLAIDPDDKIELLASQYDLNAIKALQIMTVVPGTQEQSMLRELLNKTSTIRSLNYRNKIYIDGGVNEETIQDILSLKNLPDIACVGSYLSHAGDDFERRVKYLKEMEKKTEAKT